ncbi:hypothetical protein [Leptolyngbya sp. PCC 6406]|uniref:hypothetical protein n=1 Tax=Leptolyngbya sp. PCC 6406 TaxID=1173264 RepID=UPI0002ABA79D|nr:hypothetical protein [Leptolyngbya sp. PCC 6406]
MRNPFWRMKTLPWLVLLQVSLFTLIIATALDTLLVLLMQTLPQGMALLGSGVTLMLLQLLAAGGIGALAVVIMERIFPRVLINQGVLWGLLACVTAMIFLKSFLPLTTLFVSLSQYQFVGMTVGLFSQGRRYWR